MLANATAWAHSQPVTQWKQWKARVGTIWPSRVGPARVGPAELLGQHIGFFVVLKIPSEGLFRVSSEEISQTPIGPTLGQHWADTLSFLLFCPKEEYNPENSKSPLTGGASDGVSAEPVQASMVPPPFFLHALTELASVRQQELDTNSDFPADLVIPLDRLLRRAASIVGG